MPIDPSHDTALLRRTRRGDEAAARELLARLGPSLRLYARSILRDAQLAEDAAQAALVSLFDTPVREVDAVRDAQAWLLTLTRRRAVSMLRTRARASRRESQRREETITIGPHDPDHDLAALRAAVRSLPRKMREVIALTHACGMTIDRTAETMGASRNSVAWWRREAHARLRDALDPETPATPRALEHTDHA